MKNRILLAILFVALFVWAAFERFYNLTNIGLDGSDTFFYWEMAQQYLAGDYSMTEHYRPLAYWIYAMTMAIGGVNFYSIKFLNCGLDLLNGGLTAIIAYRMTRQPHIALVASVLYFALVEPVIQARTELLHIPSATPFLLSFLIFDIAFARTGRPITQTSMILFGSGIFLGIAANIHPTVALWGPGFVLCAVIWACSREKDQIEVRAVTSMSSYTLGFAFPFFLISALVGGKEVSGSISASRGAQTQSLSKFGENLIWAFKNFVLENSSILFALLVLATTLYVLYSGILRRRPFSWTAILILAVSYMVLYMLLVPKYRLSRTFLPMMPLVICFGAAVFWDLFRKIDGRKSVSIAIIALTATIYSLRFTHAFPSLNEQPSVYMEAKEALSDSSAPVLVVPLIVEHVRAPFAREVYMGQAAQYLFHMPTHSVGQIIKESPFNRVIFFKEKWDYRVMSLPELNVRSFRKRVTPYFGWAPEEYTPEKELSFWREFLPKAGFELVSESNRFVIWRKP